MINSYDLLNLITQCPGKVMRLYSIAQLIKLLSTGSTAEPLGSAYAAQFGSAFAAAPLGSVLGSAAAAAAGKQVEGRQKLCDCLFCYLLHKYKNKKVNLKNKCIFMWIFTFKVAIFTIWI